MKTPNTIKKIRNTFGVIDKKTNKKYSDILTSFIKVLTLTPEDLDYKYLIIPSEKYGDIIYHLKTDSTLRNKLREEYKVECIVSFQIRRQGNVAVARIYESFRKNGEKK